MGQVGGARKMELFSSCDEMTKMSEFHRLALGFILNFRGCECPSHATCRTNGATSVCRPLPVPVGKMRSAQSQLYLFRGQRQSGFRIFRRSLMLSRAYYPIRSLLSFPTELRRSRIHCLLLE